MYEIGKEITNRRNQTITVKHDNDTILRRLEALKNSNTPQSGFAESLYSQWHQRGLSSEQMWWAHKTVQDSEKNERIGQAVAQHPVEPFKVGNMPEIRSLFDMAGKTLRRPKVRFDFGTEWGMVQLSVAGANSKHPGAINVTDGGRFGEGIWWGRITLDGVFVPNQKQPKESLDVVCKFLSVFAKRPAEVASYYGRLTGNCCFCARRLTDERSVYVGYGPVCAEHYHLPWGDLPPEQEIEEPDFARELSTLFESYAAKG